MRRCSPAWLFLGLVACEAEEAPGPAPASISEYKQRLDALTDQQRNGVFLRAVRDAGAGCQDVIGSAYHGIEFSMPSWVARCENGTDWMIMLDKGGRAHVARREEKPAAGTPVAR